MVKHGATAGKQDNLIPFQTTTFQYDIQGNLLREERKAEESRQESIYSYDGFNRQKKIINFENKVQVNHYDGEGLRHEMEENGKLVKFLYNDREAVAEEKEDGNIIRFIRGYDLVASDSESARTYYHYASDEQGSITHVLGEDKDGEYSLKNYYEYGAFGDFREQYEEAENRFGYNGEIFDPIGGQYYLRARYYNPVIGRFTQEDTYYGDGLNLYAYCRNLPVGYEDPSGHSAHSICENKYNKLKEKEANGTLTDAEKKELKRYERAKNDPLYQLERETGQNSGQLYNKLKQEGYTRNQDGTWSDKNGNSVSIDDLRTKVKGKSGSSLVTVGDNNQSIVYRVIRSDENPINGLIAKNPTRGMSIEGHIISGSRNKASQFISTTTDINVANKYANRDGCRIVEIDLTKLPSNVNIYDLSTVSGRNTYLKGITAKNFAAKSSEVLLEGYIPSEAVSLH